MICGLDEAGRGPVIGPMVVAGVQVEDEKKLEGFNIRDSKKCTPKRRERLAEIIRNRSNVDFFVIDAREIDDLRKEMSLNEIEVYAFSNVMRSLKSDVYYVDSADVDEKRFERNLRDSVGFNARIISEHKAEDKFIIVAAASIMAKTMRDKLIKEIEAELRTHLDIPLGSGYPSDPKTLAFLREWIKRFGKLPPYVRKSWKTTKKLLEELSFKSLF